EVARTTANGSPTVGEAAGDAAGPHASVQQHNSKPTPSQAATERTACITRQRSTRPKHSVAKLCYKIPSRHREVDGSRAASPSSKRLLGQLPGRGWVRLPCTSARQI